MLGFLVGFRKFVIMMLFLLTMVVFRVLGYISGAEFADNLQLAVVAYFSTNIGEHLIDLGRDWLKGKLNVGDKSEDELEDLIK